MKTKILKILKNNQDFISGEEISREFNMTRASIWKYINMLKEEGYDIESIPRKGYRMISTPDILTYVEIEDYLKTEYIGRHIHYFESIDSTNRKAKEIAFEEKEGTILVAEEQVEGKGRLGRNWISLRGKGIYMSIILKPQISPEKVSKLTLLGAASVYRAMNNMGIDAEIKWPNDILIKGKKVCGILTEMNAELNMVNYCVMGIGINVNLHEEDIPKDLREKASSIRIAEEKFINRKELLGKILNEFEILYDNFINNEDVSNAIEICRENSILKDREIKVIKGNEIRFGTALDIDDDGNLIVKFQDGLVERIYSGEVSIRGKDGYI